MVLRDRKIHRFPTGCQSGLAVCAQPRRILPRQLCERARENRKIEKGRDTIVGLRDWQGIA